MKYVNYFKTINVAYSNAEHARVFTECTLHYYKLKKVYYLVVFRPNSKQIGVVVVGFLVPLAI